MTAPTSPDATPRPGDAGAAPQQQVRVKISDREMQTLYANAFRSNATTDEVFLDFGINMLVPKGSRADSDEAPRDEVRFDVTHRVILNYYTAKRLALLLGDMIRQHEARFGELKLNVNDRLARSRSTRDANQAMVADVTGLQG